MNNNISVFIPDGDVEQNYSEFKVQLFRSVPKNVCLLRKNRISSTLYVTNSGLNIVFPWEESKFVTKASKPLDPPKEEYKTKDGIIVTVDTAVSAKISDPVKFEVESMAPIDEFYILLKETLRVFIAKKALNELMGKRFSIDDIGGTNFFNQFNINFGFEITKFYIKDVKPPKEMEDDLQKNVLQEIENTRKISEAKNAKEVAEINRQTVIIEGEAKTEVESLRILRIFETLSKNSLLSEREKLELIKAIILKDGNASVIANLGYNDETTNKILSYIKAQQAPFDENIEVKAKKRTK